MAELSVGIDSKGAVQGSKEVVGALDNIGKAADNVTTEVEKMSGTKAVLSSMGGWFKEVGVNVLGLLSPFTVVSAAINLFFLALEPLTTIAGFFLSLLNPMNLVNAAFDLLGSGLSLISSAFTGFFSIIQSGLQFFANLKLTVDGMISAFNALTAPIIAVGQAFGTAVSTSAEFQVQMSNIQAVSLGTAEDMLKIKDAALAVGRDTPLAASQAAEALLNLSKAGLTAEQGIAALAPAVNAALASGAELDLVSKTLINTTNAMSLGFDNSAQTLDVLLMTTTKTSQSMAGLGAGLSFVAPTLAALNQDLETGAAVLGKLADAGFEGSRAGTGLNQILLKLQNPTKTITETFKNFGLSMADVNPLTNQFTDILGKMEAAGIKSSDVIGAFGIRAGPQLGALLNQGSESVKKLSEELQNAAGTGMDMFEIQTDNLSKTIISLEGSFESLQIAIGDTAQKGFQILVEEAIVVTNKIRNFVLESGLAEAATQLITAASKELVEIFRLFKPVIDPVIATLREFGAFLTEAIPDEFKDDANEMVDILTNGMGSGTESIKSAVDVIKVWIGTWSTALEKTGGFKEGLKNVGIAIDDVVTDFLLWITDLDNWNDMAAKTMSVIHSLTTTITLIGGIAVMAGKKLYSIVDAFIDINRQEITIDFAAGFKKVFDLAINFIKQTGIPAIVAAIRLIKTEVFSVFAGLAPEAAKALKGGEWVQVGVELFTLIKGGLTPIFNDLRKYIASEADYWSYDFGDAIRDGDWVTAISEIYDILDSELTTVFNDLRKVFAVIGDKWSETAGKSIRDGEWGKLGEELWTAVKPALSAALDKILGLIDEKLGGAISLIKKVAGAAGTALNVLGFAAKVATAPVGFLAKGVEMFAKSTGIASKDATTAGAAIDTLGFAAKVATAPIGFLAKGVGLVGEKTLEYTKAIGNNVAAMDNIHEFNQKIGRSTANLASEVNMTTQEYESFQETGSKVIDTMSAVEDSFTSANEYISGKGKNVTEAYMKDLGLGISENVEYVEYAVAGVGEYMMGQSPPKKGPLKNIDKGGFNVGASWITGLSTGVKDNVSIINNSMNAIMGSLKTSGAAIATSGTTAGATWGTSFADGISRSSSQVSAAIDQMRKMTVGQSPPPEGPLKNIDVGARNIGESFNKNLAAGISGNSSIPSALSSVSPTSSNNTSNMISLSINVKGGGSPEQDRQTGQNVADSLLNELRKTGVSFA